MRNGNWGFENGPDDVFIASGIGQRAFVTEEAGSVAGQKILQRNRIGKFLIFLARIHNAVKFFDMAESIVVLILQLGTKISKLFPDL